MKKVAKHKLALNTTTIRQLNANDMGQVNGASGNIWCGPTVACSVNTCSGGPSCDCSGPAGCNTTRTCPGTV
jgi:hypothetical protein